MKKSFTVCVKSDVDSLKEIAARFCVRNPYTFCQSNPSKSGYELQEGVLLPEPIGERILSICKDQLRGLPFEFFVKLFQDTQRTRLQQVDLSNSDVTDEILEFLTNHQISELNISGCKLLTHAALNSIAKLKNLQSLIIGSGFHIFEIYQFKKGEIMYPYGNFFAGKLSLFPPWEVPELHSFINLPLLKSLVIHDLPILAQNSCFTTIVDFSKCLTHLDLSYCNIHLDHMNSFLASSILDSLILRDVPYVENLFHTICSVKTLRKLDISNTGSNIIMYSNPDEILDSIVTSLENLEHLDISGTNLAGVGNLDSYLGETDERATDIPGLVSRVNRPLKFLGLLDCEYDASYRTHIPAEQITGFATEEQILAALQFYFACNRMMQKVFPILCFILANIGFNNKQLTLDLLIQAMRQQLEDVVIQVHGSICIDNIGKAEPLKLLDTKLKRRIIKLSVEAICFHSYEMVLRNFFLLLKGFEVSDLLFEFKGLIMALQWLLYQDFIDELMLGEIVSLLKDVAHQADGVKRQFMCDRDLIFDILKIVYVRLQCDSMLDKPKYDDIMNRMWEIMLLLTEGTSTGALMFIQGGGLNLFLLCYKAFPEENDLLLNMLRLLGNVAEVEELRHHLMNGEYISAFSELVNYETTEVSYSAARIIFYLASSISKFWKLCKMILECNDVIERMKEHYPQMFYVL